MSSTPLSDNAFVSNNVVDFTAEMERIQDAIRDAQGIAEVIAKLLGLPEEVAKRFCDRVGLQFEIVARDGESYIITHDFNNKRVRVEICRGIIIDAHCG